MQLHSTPLQNRWVKYLLRLELDYLATKELTHVLACRVCSKALVDVVMLLDIPDELEPKRRIPPDHKRSAQEFSMHGLMLVSFVPG